MKDKNKIKEKVKKGIKNFQAKYINLSNRKRGRTERIQTMNNKKIKKKKVNLKKKKKKDERREKKIILEYSLRKIKVKDPEPNSVLNPLTNSLSPSEKS